MEPKDKNKTDRLTPEALEAIEKCLKRFIGKNDKEYLREFLTDCIRNGSLVPGILDEIPKETGEVGKLKFDQLYDAALHLAYPEYSGQVLRTIMGDEYDPEIKIWRVIIPEKFKIAAVLIRAKTYQDAFALACDYACRASLRLFRTIPRDLTIRVAFVTDKGMRKQLKFRVISKRSKRKIHNFEGREFTHKQLNGARIFALGHDRNDPRRSLAYYVDRKDLEKLLTYKGQARKSGVEAEILMADMKKLNEGSGKDDE